MSKTMLNHDIGRGTSEVRGGLMYNKPNLMIRDLFLR